MAFRVFLVPLLLLLGSCRLALSNLDMYMNTTETKRLLGIKAELFYVRNGIINNYALGFDVPIRSNIDEIYFNWQNLCKLQERALCHMYYSMAISVSKPRAMGTPVSSITKDGVVPTKLSSFKITLPCSGLLSTEVDIKIQMNISIFSAANVTTLNIKRKKTCLKGNEYPVVNIPRILRNETSPVGTSKPESFYKNSTNIFYIAVGVACGLIFIIAIFVGICYIRSQKSASQRERISEASSYQTLPSQAPTFLRADTPNNASTSGKTKHNQQYSSDIAITSALSTSRRAFTPVPDIKPANVRTVLSEIHIERKRISLGDVLMEGTFGRVYLGVLIGEDENEMSSQQEVYIKTTTDQARVDQVDTMMREACMMKGLSHPNINPLIGACLHDNQIQPLLVFVSTSQGNLKKFLHRCKVSDLSSHQSLSTQQLVYMAIQVIRGAQFLHRKRILHRDMATRNCVVDSDLTLKLTDNALARDLFPNDYHCLGDNENRPVKWLAIESLEERKFSAGSDVWSFGVVLWELLTLAQQPYADVDPFEMSLYLRDGYRMSQPVNCPDELFAVMACCWAMAPDERPKFSQLLTCLQDFYTALGKYI